MIKQTILFIPRIAKAVLAYMADSYRFLKHSNTLLVDSTRCRMETNIIYQYHVVEKGLAMPNRRWNFGHPKILQLVRNCNQFVDRHGSASGELLCAAGVLRTYLEEHEHAGVAVPDDVTGPIRALIMRLPDAAPVPQKSFSRDEFFARCDSPFPEFAASRASVRTYSAEPISKDDLSLAIETAKSAPSACNRQTVRVHVVQEREKIDRLLAYQNGNKGFGHLADKLLILTYDISGFRGANERNFGWLDCGIFSMNLLLALHHHKIGACPLNTGFSAATAKKVREIAEIPSREEVCLFITCGRVPEAVNVTNSRRKSLEEIASYV